MDVREPQMRRRGFFLHSETGEPDTGEHETAEGVATRIRITRSDSSQTVRQRPPKAGRSRHPGTKAARRSDQGA